MAEDEDGVSNRKSQQNSDKPGTSQDNSDHTTPKPDLGIEEAKYNSNENGDSSPTEPRCSSSKSSGSTRKDENPFSFRHFLKRDLSLPGNSTYENTGARPKVYANTVQHSPTKTHLGGDTKRERPRATEPQAKDSSSNDGCHRNSDNTSSSSSVEIPFSVVDNSDSKHNLYVDNTESNYFHRPNLASEPLGMPSLPDFVQDHILVEQAYLNPNGPLSVDLDNLPDFTFNTNFNLGGSPSISRRSASNYGGSRSYDYESYMGAASTSADPGPSRSQVPLDLPVGAEAVPPDLSAHLSLDLTESLNQDRRNVSPSRNFPLDLPPNAGEAMRLPDFLPVHPGRTSPETENEDEQLQQIMSELERTRSELFSERSRRSRLESELSAAHEELTALRSEAVAARASEAVMRQRLQELGLGAGAGGAAAAPGAAGGDVDADVNPTCNAEAERVVSALRQRIHMLNEELTSRSADARALRVSQQRAAATLRRAAQAANHNLSELLAGVEQLRELSIHLDPS